MIGFACLVNKVDGAPLLAQFQNVNLDFHLLWYFAWLKTKSALFDGSFGIDHEQWLNYCNLWLMNQLQHSPPTTSEALFST